MKQYLDGKEFCDSPCANLECPKNGAHVPDKTELPVAWSNMAPGCPDYQDLPEYMDEISGTGALMGVWD